MLIAKIIHIWSHMSMTHTPEMGRYLFSSIMKKKSYDSFLWMGFNCLKATEPLLFTTKSPEIPGIHFIDLRWMKG